MSRSYRKNPVLKNGKSAHQLKKLASRHTRRIINRGDSDGLPMSLGGYKKLYDSWDIWEYTSRYSISDVKKYISKSYNEYKSNGFSPVVHKTYVVSCYYTLDGKPYHYILNDMLNGVKIGTDIIVKKKYYNWDYYIFKEDTFEEFVRNTWVNYKKTWMCK